MLGLSVMGGLVFIWGDTDSVFIESAESKNHEMKSVFNEIRFFPGAKKDIWMMNQSHSGRDPQELEWERLAIVVDKTQTPARARYYQLQAGPLVWEEDLIQKQSPYRASCFICHNNGPRALRPVNTSQEAKLSWMDLAKIQLWNLRIKTYGRIQYDPEHDKLEESLKVPFSFHTKEDQDELKVKTCVICHQDKGLVKRGFLKRQQTGTIRSLIERGEMPPPGFYLSQKEEKELQDFLKGF